MCSSLLPSLSRPVLDSGLDCRFQMLELPTNLREDHIVTEKALTRALDWLKLPTSAFTFKSLLRHYAKWAPKQTQ